MGTNHPEWPNNQFPVVRRKPGTGLLEAARRKLEAACTEAITDAELRIMAAEAKVSDLRRNIGIGELAARLQATKIARELAQETVELNFWHDINNVGSNWRAMLTDAVSLEELLTERTHIHHHRLSGSRYDRPQPSPLPAPHLPALPEPALIPHIDANATEKLAMKALAKLGALSGPAAEEAWRAWARGLRDHFPELTAASIEARAAELRRLAQE